MHKQQCFTHSQNLILQFFESRPWTLGMLHLISDNCHRGQSSTLTPTPPPFACQAPYCIAPRGGPFQACGTILECIGGGFIKNSNVQNVLNLYINKRKRKNGYRYKGELKRSSKKCNSMKWEIVDEHQQVLGVGGGYGIGIPRGARKAFHPGYLANDIKRVLTTNGPMIQVIT